MAESYLIYGWKLPSRTVEKWILSKNSEEDIDNMDSFYCLDENYDKYFPSDWKIEGFDEGLSNKSGFEAVTWFLRYQGISSPMTINEIKKLPQTFTDKKLLTLLKELKITKKPMIHAIADHTDLIFQQC
jgi:hypothetical protein